MFNKFILIALLHLFPVLSWAGPQSEAGPGEVNVYTHRHYDTDQQLFDTFEEQTGIRVNVVNAGADELIQRLATEGELSPADILITADAGRLVYAKSLGLTQGVESTTLESNIPASFRDPEGHWFGLTLRGRVIVYNKETTSAENLSTYAALTGEEFADSILVRSSSNIYNQSLLAAFIAHDGEEAATQWAAGILANMAREPKGNDRDQMKALVAGEGEYAIVNTYYVGKLLASDDPAEVEVGEKIGVFFPDQEGRGTHMNISGAAVTAHSPNRENAIQLLEFLTSQEAQESFAQANFEYPVREGVELHPVVASWGEFKRDDLNLSKLGELNTAAVKVFDQVGWK